MLVFVGMEKDCRGRTYPVYLDTDDLSDEDYAEYCRLLGEKKVLAARRLLIKRRSCSK